MLLEHLSERAGRRPEYDWHSYYRWLFSRLAGGKVAGLNFRLCPGCFSVHIDQSPDRYGKCPGCGLIYRPTDAGGRR